MSVVLNGEVELSSRTLVRISVEAGDGVSAAKIYKQTVEELTKIKNEEPKQEVLKG